MATWYRDATPAQQGIVMGVPSLRGNWRQFRILVDGRGEQPAEDFGGAEAGFVGEAGTEGGENCCG